MGEDGHARLRLDPRDEALAAAGHEDVERAVEAGEHGADRRAVAGRHELDRLAREAGFREPLPHGVGERARRAKALGAGAQHRGVAGLEAERAGVGGHVRPALEDHAHHPERRRHALDQEAVRALEGRQHPADRIGQGGDAVHRGGDRLHPLRVEREPVEKGRILPAPARLGEVVPVRRKDPGLGRPDRGGHGAQGRVLLGRPRQAPAAAMRRGRPGPTLPISPARSPEPSITRNASLIPRPLRPPSARP